MYSTLFSRALFAATTVSGVLATFSIETPPLTQCQDATISWSPGDPPYYLVVVSPHDPCGDPVLDLGTSSVTSFTWNVALHGGSSVKLYVEDSGYNEAWSGIVTISKSDDSSCLSQAVLSTPTPSTNSSSGQDQDSTYVMYTPTTHRHLPSSSPTPSSSPSPNPPNPSPPDTSGGLVPIGAANAGTNPLSSGASSMDRAGAPIMTVFATFAAAIALAL